MSNNGARDTIQISLGSTANAITAHSLNLQGLAATSNSGDSDGPSSSPICDTQTTHHLEKNHWVPRVLMVDEPTRYFVPQISQAQLLQQQSASFWSGTVEPFMDPQWTLQHDTPEWSSVFTNASVLAYSSHSRYYQEPVETTTYRASAANPRHVNWDDDEQEEAEQEDPRERQARLQRQRNDWRQNTQEPLQEQLLAEDWDKLFETKNFVDFLMPPYSTKSLLALPFSSQTSLVANWDAYHFHTDSSLKEWKEDVLFEGLRRLLEDSDACQGVSITTQGSGLYAGLTTALLQELQEECSSAGRMVYHVSTNSEDVAKEETEKDWHTTHVDRLRRHVGSGLALHDFCQNAHAVLPLQLPSTLNDGDSSSFFKATAQVAMALETQTLPMRLMPIQDARYKIGLLNAPFFGGQDTQWGSSGQRLSVKELLQCLQPSSQYSVLELDTTLLSTVDNQSIWTKFKAGTSVERDQRMRESGRDGQLRRPRDAAPGEWLDDVQHGGILTSFSHSSGDTTSRSLHHHFALGASVRTVLQDDISDYLTCMVQGMGIRYRPERSMCSVLDQTVGQLTTDGGGGGAGSYWSKLIPHKTPIVSVIGNTTRIYPFLEGTSAEFKTVLGPRYKGYYQRDLVSGILPEREDCEEALAKCLDIRDTYLPPDGSGLVPEEGEDFY